MAARRPGTFRVRAAVALITFAIAAFTLLFASVSAGWQGSRLFQGLAIAAFIFCLLEGTRISADCVSEEKREGTLGLLFLTDLRGYDIALGKMVAVSVRSFQGLFAFLPVLAICLVLGGVTAGEFWRTALVLINALFFSTCLGIFVSTNSEESHRALIGCFSLLLVLCVAPPNLGWLAVASGFSELKSISWVSPAAPGLLVQDVSYRLHREEFWGALAVSHALAWLLLGGAAVLVPRVWQDRPVVGVPIAQDSAALAHPKGRAERRARMLDRNPILWLAARNQPELILPWLFVSCGGVIAAMVWYVETTIGFTHLQVSAAVAWLLTIALKVWVASQASSTLAEARRNGAIELLMATPISVDDIIRGQWLALQRIFLWPVVALVLMNIVIVIGQFAGFDQTLRGSQWLIWAPLAGQTLFQTITVLVDMVAVAWFGMWMGLTAKRPAIAFGKTVLFAIILPFLLFCLPNVLIDLILISWSMTRLRNEFRRAASERAGFEGEWPFTRSPARRGAGVPPVIVTR